MNRRILYFLASILMIALVFLLMDGSDSSVEENITVLEKEITTHETGMRFVEPKLKNNTDQSYTNVRIDVLLFDANKKVLDKFSIETKEIPAGQIWNPRIPTEYNAATDFEILMIHSDQEIIER